MKVLKGITSIVSFLVYLLIYYLFLPTLSLAYLDGFVFISVGIILLLALIAWWFSEDEDDYKYIIPSIGIIAFIVFLIGGLIIGSPIFTSSIKYNQIGKIEEMNFKEDIVELDTSQIPTVDINLASKVADKKLGEELALGSQMEVGEFTNKQQVNEKLLYIAPLEHRSFFKWFSNQQGTSGYILVSATNPNDINFVREVNGKSLNLKYLKNSYFSSDLKRHIRSSGFRSTGLGEINFEIDDDGNPYWIVSTYKNTTLWGTPEATGIIICDPQSGKCDWYSIEDAPEWVDIVQPESFVIEQIKNYGRYVHGFINPSDKDELSMTEHVTTVYNDGHCYYYTGLSSVGRDDGTVGFIMVDTRNKSAKLYRMVGATESAAMRSAEGTVSDMGYTATTPIPLNVSGVPTYFLTLKDAEGLVKQYSMLKIEDYSIVASGSTIAETQRTYINAVNNSGASVDFGNKAYGYTFTGTVTRIGYNIEQGNTYYYLIIDNDESRLFIASYMISEELPITREGDIVEISYVDNSNGVINIVSFNNVGFSQQISPEQEEINQEQEQNNLINNPENGIIKVDPESNEEIWNNLTDEEKAELLQKLQEEYK